MLIKKHLTKLLLLSAALMFTLGFIARTAKASDPNAPYAVAVQSSSATGVTDPSNAVGPPDGQYTRTVGIGATATLDKGLGSEGTGTLRVFFGPAAGSTVKVDLLDASFNVLSSTTRTLLANPGPTTQDFPYSSTAAPYRYVRLSSQAEGGLTIDAIQALAFVGQNGTGGSNGANGANGSSSGSSVGSGSGQSANSTSASEPIVNKLEIRKGTPAHAPVSGSGWWSRFLTFASSFEFCAEGLWFWAFILGLLILLFLAYLVGFISGENCEATPANQRSRRQRFLHKLAKGARRNQIKLEND